MELEQSDALLDLTSAIAKPKDAPWVMNDKTKSIFAVVDPVFHQLRTNLKIAIAILKWRHGFIDGPLDSFSNWSEDVSLKGTAWRGIPMTRSLRMTFSQPFSKIGLATVHETGRLHNEGMEPPLGVQLLIEAWNQRTTHPRSALVIGVTAAEIALKQLIGELAPDARWLADNVPSPPILKIARDYIPTLSVKVRLNGKTLRPPKQLLKRLEKAVDLRNKVVHAGEAPHEPEKLKEILSAMGDLVWICNLYAGHTWAWEHISSETKSAWESEK